MASKISFVLDGKIATIDFKNSSLLTPTTTVLNYLRSLPSHKGVKEGCAEGDCGACTVVVGELNENNSLRYKSVDSCLLFLPRIHGKELITVENLRDRSGELHPVQTAMMEASGSQCGFCTPGVVMSLFSLYKNFDRPTRSQIDDALTGNLCRCTGYRPIIEAAAHACVHKGIDHLTAQEGVIAGLLRSIPKEPLQIETEKQSYFKPMTLRDALVLKRNHPGAIVLCGATDVALRVTKKHELLREIIDVSDVEDLKGITENPGFITIGSGVTINEIMRIVDREFHPLYDILRVFGSQQIRNVATLGGNLGTASPIGDTLPVLMAYGAKVTLESPDGKRALSLDDYFIGYRKTAIAASELITSIIIPKIKHRTAIRSYKVSKRKDLDISTVSGGFRIDVEGDGSIKNIVLAYGGMAEKIKRAASAERYLFGKRWDRDIVEQAMPLIDKDFTPISDARGSAEFRKVAARNLLLKFWTDTMRND
ncbi:MAG: xanthine dehydrogenase small subunit [Bacteroidota bacterium]